MDPDAASRAYRELLDAVIGHLEQQVARGVRHGTASAATLAALAGTPAAPRSAPLKVSRPAGAPTPSTPAPVPTGPARVSPGSPPGTLREPLTGPGVEDREAAMAAIRERALACVQCPHLVRSRTQVVFGVGSLQAEVMFVGEAPGVEEDRRGEPFVGPAGQLLTKIIGAMGYSRETVYIANVLKCRPDTAPGMRGNRAPRPDEMDTCKPYLLSQIEIIRPKVLVTLGVTAVKGLLGVEGTMGSLRGRWQEFRGIPVMPTFHPSYLLRAEEGPDKGFTEKRKTWEDLLKVLERLGRPITDKMRGYFLRPTPGGASGNTRGGNPGLAGGGTTD